MLRTLTTTAALVLTTFSLAVPAQRFTPAEGADPLHVPFDQLLDSNVRDGLVYYRALRSERGRLDRYVASLNVPAPTYSGWPKDQQIAFWLNAYNAFVLDTVVDNYPIRARLATFPANSIKQIAGAFEGTKHRAAGRMVTLDEIEKTILPEFKDPRLYFALGRGAMSSGRLRSEAYTAQRLRAQLESIQKEFVNYQEMVQVDRVANTVSVTPIFSWRDTEFVAAYDPGATGTYSQRSPIERAIIAFVMPNLLSLEKELLQKNQFKVQFHQFDWRLNDLSGR
jgi:hypothetical protein